MYHRILVPMEHEQQQELALEHARKLAQSSGATVVLAWLVPVVASGERFFSQIQVEPGSSGARRREKGEAYLSQAVASFREAGVEVRHRVVIAPEPPEDTILNLVAEEGADLILMSTLLQSAVGRFLFGSVEEKVRQRSPVPVLFVNPQTQPGEGGS